MASKRSPDYNLAYNMRANQRVIAFEPQGTRNETSSVAAQQIPRVRRGNDYTGPKCQILLTLLRMLLRGCLRRTQNTYRSSHMGSNFHFLVILHYSALARHIFLPNSARLPLILFTYPFYTLFHRQPHLPGSNLRQFPCFN